MGYWDVRLSIIGSSIFLEINDWFIRRFTYIYEFNSFIFFHFISLLSHFSSFLLSFFLSLLLFFYFYLFIFSLFYMVIRTTSDSIIFKHQLARLDCLTMVFQSYLFHFLIYLFYFKFVYLFNLFIYFSSSSIW